LKIQYLIIFTFSLLLANVLIAKSIDCPPRLGPLEALRNISEKIQHKETKSYGCSPEDEAKLLKALQYFRKRLNEASKQIDKEYKNITKKLNVLAKGLNSSNETRKRFKDTITCMQRKTERERFDFRCKNDDSYVGMVTSLDIFGSFISGEGSMKINIEAMKHDTPEMVAGVISHELSHLCGVKDYVYYIYGTHLYNMNHSSFKNSQWADNADTYYFLMLHPAKK
jgi:predicted SprT family Zn-dependent metalloprotease